MTDLPLLAFGFANLAILGWLAAAAAPILIHLWMRRVRKETRWAAVRFLQAAIRRHARRLQLQQWLLLAIRTAILLLVVLAAAKPVLDALPLATSGGSTHRMLVIDASLSMNWQDQQGSLLNRAKQLAIQLVDQSPPGDAFTVCMLSSTPHATLSVPTTDRARARVAIQAIEPTSGGASLANGLALVQKLLSTAQATTGEMARTEVTFFTDLAAHTWQDVAAGADGQAAQRYAQLVDQALLSVVDVGQPDASNTAVVSASISDAAPTTRSPVEVRAQLRSFQKNQQPLQVDLLVDGLTVDTQTAVWQDSPDAWVTLSHPIRTAGIHNLTIKMGEDALPQDNARQIACEVVDSLRVLCIEGRSGAGRMIASALNPSGEAGASIQPEVVSDAALGSLSFSDFPCLFFCNVPQLTMQEADRLRRYVAAGGGVVFFLGDRVLPQRYNQTLGSTSFDLSQHSADPVVTLAALTDDSAAPNAFLPAKIGSQKSVAFTRTDPLLYAHPIVAPFRGRERAGLLSTPISRYFELQISDSSTAKVALATASGDPLIATHPVGSGRVILVATDGSLQSIDPTTGEPWTLLPAWPSFVPIVRELLNFALGEAPSELLVGEAWKLPAETSGEVTIRRPSGQLESLSTSQPGQTIAYDRTNEVGIYRLQQPDRALTLAAVAVNPDPAESDLTKLSPNKLPAEFMLRSITNAGDAAEQLVAATGIHRWLLLMALWLMLLETFLAYWFGRSAA